MTCTCTYVSLIEFAKLNRTAIEGRYNVDPLVSGDLETGNQDAQISLGMRQVLNLTTSHLLKGYRGCVYLTQPSFSLHISNHPVG
jgi:hypothetical protein